MAARDYLGEHINPHLTEPGVKYFMTETLKICNVSKPHY